MTRINMMSNYSIERRLKIGNLNKNKIFSKETIEKWEQVLGLDKTLLFWSAQAHYFKYEKKNTKILNP